ncbi:MAG TPA: HAMP domain-containing sensor histidine kinase [Blastococcus sp.]|jgi:two-component system OmpR family sensor kinase|nr:HAMP domain-containing sensor histidine kinase [Blastococcus sp.]
MPETLPSEPGTTASKPRSRRRLSLRARLLWAFIVPLVVVVSVVGVAATTALRVEQLAQVDSQLATAVDRSARADESSDGDADNAPSTPPHGGAGSTPAGPAFLFARGQGDGTLGARVVHGVSTESGVIGDRGQIRALTDEQKEIVAAVPADGKPRTVDLGSGLGHYRLIASTVPDGDVLVTGLPLGSAQQALLRLIAVEVAVGIAGLIAAGVASLLIIHRTLRPLHRVAQTATRVAELPLSTGEVQLAERVPPADTDTHTEVGQVGHALNRLLDHVEGSLAARQASETQVRQFVADASHELRTPVASIRGYAELMRRRDGDVPDDVGHAMRRVESEALRMSGLVDDLLLLARLDAGRDLATGDVDLTALLVDTVSDAHVAGPNHKWRVDQPGAAVTVPGDEARLHQVLANLLANIRTHTPEGTTATARLRVVNGWAEIQIEDDGPGIPRELLGHVFERFARGDSSRSRLAGSTGLGLAIVHAVVTAHGGTVAVSSVPGRTIFVVRLPHATVTESPAD